MNTSPILTLIFTLVLSAVPFLDGKAIAQEFNRECVQATGSCAYNDYPKNNPNLYLRTAPQASQNPVNRVDRVCADGLSTNCDQYLVPKTEELQESNTFQQLRQRQINTVEERQ